MTVPPSPPVGVRELHREPGPAAVEVADPGVEPGVHEQRVAGVALEPRAALHLLDHGGVEADPGVEQEVPPVDRAQPHPPDRARGPARRAAPRWPRSGRWAGRWCGRTRWSTRRAAGPARTWFPARPLAASLSVPSPPSTTTTSTPVAAAPWASRVAWPRRLVSATVTSWSADRALPMTTRLRGVTDEASEFTSSSTFTAAGTYCTRPAAPHPVHDPAAVWPPCVGDRAPVTARSLARGRFGSLPGGGQHGGP